MPEKVPKNGTVEGSVTAVEGRGARRFAVVSVTDEKLRQELNSTVTFSLTVWQGKHEPQAGQLVQLHDIEKFAKGWRARSAQPITLGGGR